MRSEKITNRHLRQARLRSGHSAKAVASLLGNRDTGPLSRYESGDRVPSLMTVLKLEAIYRVPVRFLFFDLYLRAERQIGDRRKSGSKTEKRSPQVIDQMPSEGVDYCTFVELLRMPNLPPNEADNVYAHVRYLAKALLLRD